jgi:hypothetical protein
VSQKENIKAAFETWMKPLGLLWWSIDIVYHEDPADVISYFKSEDGAMILGRTFTDWQYGQACIHINVPGFEGMDQEHIERVAVHELMHVLVNEMREGELHHEERVVTTLTKAIFWTVKSTQGELA